MVRMSGKRSTRTIGSWLGNLLDSQLRDSPAWAVVPKGALPEKIVADQGMNVKIVEVPEPNCDSHRLRAAEHRQRNRCSIDRR